MKRTVAGVCAAALLISPLTACGDDGQTPDEDPGAGQPPTATAPQTPSTPDTTPTEDVTTFEFEISDGQADPPLDRATVDVGTTVRIVVTSDQPDELHLHGYDRTAAVGPDEEGVLEFEADQTGLFELETHHSGLVLLQLQVQ